MDNKETGNKPKKARGCLIALLCVSLSIIALTILFVIASAIIGSNSPATPSTQTSQPSQLSETGSGKTELSEEEFKDQCVDFDYREFLRYPDKYEGTPVRVLVQIKQTISKSKKTYYRACSSKDGMFFFEDEYLIYDNRDPGTPKILNDDYIMIYGIYTGGEDVTRALTLTSDEVMAIEMLYCDIMTKDEVIKWFKDKMEAAIPVLTVGETWIIDDLWEFSIDAVELGSDNVITVTYSFKNLGYSSAIGLGFSAYDMTVIDAKSEIAEIHFDLDVSLGDMSYLPIGSTCTGAQQMFRLKNSSDAITIRIEKYDNNLNMRTVKYKVPLQ